MASIGERYIDLPSLFTASTKLDARHFSVQTVQSITKRLDHYKLIVWEANSRQVVCWNTSESMCFSLFWGQWIPDAMRQWILTEEFDHHAERHDNQRDQQISNGQRHQEVVCHVLQSSFPANSKTNKNIPQGWCSYQRCECQNSPIEFRCISFEIWCIKHWAIYFYNLITRMDSTVIQHLWCTGRLGMHEIQGRHGW